MLDLMIKGGSIIDGSGCAPYSADIGIKGGRICEIGRVFANARKTVDARGLTVTPGFIDSHSHSDSAIFVSPEMREKCEQGITTSIAGMCGSSSLASAGGKLADPKNLSLLEKEGKFGSNIATFVGHGTIRKAVMGLENREPTEYELDKMKSLLSESIKNGALGMSTGLIYTPGSFAKTEELMELSKVCAAEGGLLSSHMRNESDRLIEATEEFLSFIKESGARGIISHHKAAQRANHGKVNTTLGMIDKMNAEGYEVFCDVYPYTASSTSLSARFVPKEYTADGKTVENLSNSETLKKIIDYNKTTYDIDRIDWALVTSCKGHPEYEGKYISEIAKMMGTSDLDAALELIRISGNSTGACYFSMSEEDVTTVIKHPRAMICTDSGVAPLSSSYHPRLRASFPRAIRRFVRELGAISLPEMIRKMTSLPAYVYNLSGKGYIKVGYDADICVFDYERLFDRADYLAPDLHTEGLNYVIVGGEIAARDAEYTGSLNGKFIPRRQSRNGS